MEFISYRTSRVLLDPRGNGVVSAGSVGAWERTSITITLHKTTVS